LADAPLCACCERDGVRVDALGAGEGGEEGNGYCEGSTHFDGIRMDVDD
jgi:hypothetical protein